MPKPTRRKHEWTDEYTLLCERCGYIIEDLDHACPCPECGKPIIESLPIRRTGTLWQTHQSKKSLVSTMGTTLLHPIQTIETLRFDLANYDGFSAESIALSAFISLALSGLLCLAISLNIFLSLLFFGISSILALFLALALLVVAHIESNCLQIIGKVNNWRMTRQISWTIVNHACVGWLIFGIAIGFGTMTQAVAFNLESQSDNYVLADQFRFLGKLVMYPGLIVGFAYFQTLVYLGARRCKFANTMPPYHHPRPTPIP